MALSYHRPGRVYPRGKAREAYADPDSLWRRLLRFIGGLWSSPVAQCNVTGQTVSEQGSVIPNATVYFRAVDDPAEIVVTSDALGNVALLLIQGDRYCWRTAGGSSNYFTVPAASSMQLGAMIGTWS